MAFLEEPNEDELALLPSLNATDYSDRFPKLQ